jgi:hypothetical protein
MAAVLKACRLLVDDGLAAYACFVVKIGRKIARLALHGNLVVPMSRKTLRSSPGNTARDVGGAVAPMPSR